MQLNIKQRFAVVGIYILLIIGIGRYFSKDWVFIFDTSNNLNLLLIATGLALKELSDYLKLSDSAIYKLTSTSQIPHYKSGKKLYFKKEDIDKWLETKRIKTIGEIEEIALDYLNKKTKRN